MNSSQQEEDEEEKEENEDEADVFVWDYNIGRDQPEKESVVPLKLDSYSVSPAGELYFGFNKPIIIPPIKGSRRQLNEQSYYSISDVIDFKVFSDSTGTDTSGADLGILNF